MKGSVKRSGGGWGFVFDVTTVDGTRKQVRRRGFASQKKAAEAMREAMGEVRGGTLVTPSRLTVEQYLVGMWLPTVERRVRPTTVDGYRRTITRHIVPKLGGADLQAVDEAAVAQWVAALCATGLSSKTVRNVHGVLSKALADAVRLRLLTRNVAHRAELPALPTRRARVWTAEQVTASWRTSRTIGGHRFGGSALRPGCAAVRRWDSGGSTSTSRPAR